MNKHDKLKNKEEEEEEKKVLVFPTCTSTSVVSLGTHQEFEKIKRNMGGMKSGEENARPHTKLIFSFFLYFYTSDPSLSLVSHSGAALIHILTLVEPAPAMDTVVIFRRYERSITTTTSTITSSLHERYIVLCVNRGKR
jgi:hypothetical protein